MVERGKGVPGSRGGLDGRAVALPTGYRVVAGAQRGRGVTGGGYTAVARRTWAPAMSRGVPGVGSFRSWRRRQSQRVMGRLVILKVTEAFAA